MQSMQQERESRTTIERERDEWRTRTARLQKEMNNILLATAERDRHDKELRSRVSEVERVNQKLRETVSSLERELSSARKSLRSAKSSSKSPDSPHSGITREDVDRHVEESVAKVATDLHSAYKEKHETKVAAIKKSYASRWERRVKDIETKLHVAMEENTQLKMSQSGTKPPTESHSTSTPEDEDKLIQERTRHSEEKHAMEVRLDDLTRELSDVNVRIETLQSKLETERVEKGELVATVEEWLSIQMPMDPEGKVSGQKPEHTEALSPPPSTQLEARPGSPLRSQQSSRDTENCTVPSKRPSTSDSAQSSEDPSSYTGPPPSKKPAPSHSSQFVPESVSSTDTRKPNLAPRLPRLEASASQEELRGPS